MPTVNVEDWQGVAVCRREDVPDVDVKAAVAFMEQPAEGHALFIEKWKGDALKVYIRPVSAEFPSESADCYPVTIIISPTERLAAKASASEG